MTALNLTQEQADFEAAIRALNKKTMTTDKWPDGKYKKACVEGRWHGWQMATAWRAALAQSPVIAQPRYIPDSECVQSRCANVTTGCWGSCSMKPGGALFNSFVVVAAPVSAEGLERDAARYRHMRDSWHRNNGQWKLEWYLPYSMRGDGQTWPERLDASIDAAISATDKGTTS